MRNAIRAALILLVFVATARAGETLSPPAPQPQPAQSTWQEPSVEGTLDDEGTTPEASPGLADATLELLAILPAIL